MYHVGEGTRPCPFPVTGNGHGGVTEPQGDHFSGRNLGMIPYGFVAYTTANRRDTYVQYYHLPHMIVEKTEITFLFVIETALEFRH